MLIWVFNTKGMLVGELFVYARGQKGQDMIVVVG
jgi:hypothetical protein